MGDIRLEVAGISRVVRILNPAEWHRAVSSGIMAAALEVKGAAAEYPPDELAHRPQPFVSDRQRRYFFAALRRGEIEVPYRRGFSPGSESLGRRWTIKTTDRGLTGVIGNNASYARYVQGAGFQTAYHAETGWKTDEQVAREKRERALQIVDMALSRALERL